MDSYRKLGFDLEVVTLLLRMKAEIWLLVMRMTSSPFVPCYPQHSLRWRNQPLEKGAASSVINTQEQTLMFGIQKRPRSYLFNDSKQYSESLPHSNRPRSSHIRKITHPTALNWSNAWFLSWRWDLRLKSFLARGSDRTLHQNFPSPCKYQPIFSTSRGIRSSFPICIPPITTLSLSNHWNVYHDRRYSLTFLVSASSVLCKER